MGTITFHPWPVRRADVDHPDELRIDPDPQPGTDFGDAVRVATEARALLEDLGYAGFPKTSGGRGIHIYVRIEPRWTLHRRAPRRDRVRPRARAPDARRGHDEVVEGGARRARLRRLQPERARPHDRVGVQRARQARARPSRRRSSGTRYRASSPRTSPSRRCPRASPTLGDRHAAIDETAHSLDPLLEMYDRDEAEGLTDMPYPPDYPKMPGEPKRVQPSRDTDRKKG